MAQNHTHDHFFKIAFSRTNVVADFIQAFLPAEFSEQLDLTTLVRLGDSFVDEQLAQHYADLVYSVHFGTTPITVALLFEHKSYTEEYPHFQLARYMLNLWQGQLTNKETLTRVVPILIYHGQGRWKQQAMMSYFGPSNPFLDSFVPDFQYLLINLKKASDGQFSLLKDNYAKVTAGLLRTIRERRQLTRMFEELAAVFDSLVDNPDGEQFIKTAFLYVHWSSKLTSAEMVAIFNRISPKSAQVVMSAAEILLQEGLEKGLEKGFQIGVEQGIEKGIKEGVKQGLKKGVEQGLKKGVEQGLKKGVEQGLKKGVEQGIKKGVEQGIKKGVEQGIKKGVEQGIKKGVEQGIKKGVEQGDHQATVKHVKALLNAGMNTQFIASAFDLSADQLTAILAEINA